jgi:hypothetical protein
MIQENVVISQGAGPAEIYEESELGRRKSTISKKFEASPSRRSSVSKKF